MVRLMLTEAEKEQFRGKINRSQGANSLTSLKISFPRKLPLAPTYLHT